MRHLNLIVNGACLAEMPNFSLYHLSCLQKQICELVLPMTEIALVEKTDTNEQSPMALHITTKSKVCLFPCIVDPDQCRFWLM